MERFTKQASADSCYVTAKITGVIENEGYYGEAIERLAKFENIYEHLMMRKGAIPAELEALRGANKGKTVTFKELLAEKMINDMVLKLLEREGLV